MNAREEKNSAVNAAANHADGAEITNGAEPFFLCRRGFAKTLSLGFMSALVPSLAAHAQQGQTDGYMSNQQGAEKIKPQSREVLLQYGTFYTHPIYEEIWVPSKQTVPQGWHPYPPCHWVNSRKLGWFFDDKTPWGAIVHHYGRWKNDTSYGWFWVPGLEFSPGWVIWRTDNQYIGWAPMPPDQDLKKEQATSIESTDSWLFMEVKKFNTSCEGAVLPASGYPVIMRNTKFITNVRNVGGIIVYELPQYIEGAFVDININFDPWPMWFFTEIIWFWNWIWHNTVLNVEVTECWPSDGNGAVPVPGPGNNGQVMWGARRRSRRR